MCAFNRVGWMVSQLGRAWSSYVWLGHGLKNRMESVGMDSVNRVGSSACPGVWLGYSQGIVQRMVRVLRVGRAWG